MTTRSILPPTLAFTLAFALAPALLLAGCMGTENRGLETVHQPVVSRSDYLLDLATAYGGLAVGEQQRLDGWMATLRLGYGDRVAIDDPARQGTAIRDQVAVVVARRGLLLSPDTPVTAAPVAPGTVRIVVSRMYAAVPGCPDWSRDASNEFDNNTSSNHGCSINSNLAAMIARPEDLVHGQETTVNNNQLRATKAITAFRAAAPGGGGGTTVGSAGGAK